MQSNPGPKLAVVAGTVTVIVEVLDIFWIVDLEFLTADVGGWTRMNADRRILYYVFGIYLFLQYLQMFDGIFIIFDIAIFLIEFGGFLIVADRTSVIF